MGNIPSNTSPTMKIISIFLNGVCVDQQNHILLACSFNYVIRHFDKDGTISAIIGPEMEGYTVDSGRVRESRLNTPTCICNAPVE